MPSKKEITYFEELKISTNKNKILQYARTNKNR